LALTSPAVKCFARLNPDGSANLPPNIAFAPFINLLPHLPAFPNSFLFFPSSNKNFFFSLPGQNSNCGGDGGAGTAINLNLAIVGFSALSFISSRRANSYDQPTRRSAVRQPTGNKTVARFHTMRSNQLGQLNNGAKQQKSNL